MGDDPESRVLMEMHTSGAYHHEVIDLAGIRIARGMLKPREKRCEHMRLVVSQSERLIECEDCNRSVDAFDAVMVVMRHMEKMLSEVNGRKRRADEAMKATIQLRAAKSLERSWRHRMAPCCPHCHHGLLPEDFDRGAAGAISCELEVARRVRDRANPAENNANSPSKASAGKEALDNPTSSPKPDGLSPSEGAR